MRSRWRAAAETLRSRLPRGATGRPIEGIIQRYIGKGGIGFISGMTYNACTGHTHPLDGCSVDFGDHGILRDQVPSPWRELFGEMDEPLTFDLDRPDQDSPSATDAKVVAR